MGVPNLLLATGAIYPQYAAGCKNFFHLRVQNVNNVFIYVSTNHITYLIKALSSSHSTSSTFKRLFFDVIKQLRSTLTSKLAL